MMFLPDNGSGLGTGTAVNHLHCEIDKHMMTRIELYQDMSEKIEALRNILMSCATGGHVNEHEYKQLRNELITDQSLSAKLPRFVRTCSDIRQFWAFIKQQSDTYQGRRDYLSEQFRQLLSATHDISHDTSISETLTALNSDYVHEAWRDASVRRLDDPDGAITSARTLLETVCKHILDEMQVEYEDEVKLPKLYKLTAEALQLAPTQQTEPVLKQVLGGCTAVVEGIGAMRNALGDAHEKGRVFIKPEARHAELAVNLAGASAIFLIETWEENHKK